MALSRLHEIVKSFAFYYLDPLDDMRGKPQEVYVDTSGSNSGIKKIYTHNKALTFFIEETPFGNELYNVNKAQSCLGNNFRFGHRDDDDHDQWHITKDDFEQDHAHILKTLADNTATDMNQGEFNCIFKQIKIYEQSNQYCKDGRTECLLTQEDTDKVKNQYEKYLKQSRRSPRIEAAAEKLAIELEQKCIHGAKAFTQAFLTTLLERYIKPWLINQGMNYAKATWMIEIAKSAITLSLSASMINTALDAIIRNALKPVLIKAGMNETVVDMLTTEIGTIAVFTQDPFSLIEMYINGTAASMGQGAAYGIIHALPKFKKEEAAEPQNDIAEVISNDSENMNMSLRRRHVNS